MQCWETDGAYVLPENAVAVDVLGVVDAKSTVGGGIIVRATGDLAKIALEKGRRVAKPFLPDIHDAVDASAECAVRATGAVVCWGDDDHYGQLGAGTKARSEVIVHVRGLP